MRGEALNNVVQYLQTKRRLDFSQLNALEFFARKGNWHTLSYANKVSSITAWEIEAEFRNDLITNIPHAAIRIGDSFGLAKEGQYSNSFSLIVFDNPQGVFGKYCEHFECLNLIPDLLSKDGGVVIFNINKTPFN